MDDVTLRARHITPLRWGVVGCGWVARDYGLPALRAATNSALVAVCDPDLGACEWATRGTEARTYERLEHLLEDSDVEAVYVATPNHLHAEQVVALAQAGKHVLCEKPMALAARDGESMVEACAAAGVRYATAFDQRFHAAHQHLRALIEAGRLGTVTCVRIHYACWTPPDWTPDGVSLDNWRADPARAGGGAMIDLAPHGLDLAQMLFGEPLVDLACFLQHRVFDYPVDDGAVLIGRTPSGALLSHSVAYNCPDVFPRRQLEVIGTRGRAFAFNTMGQTPGGRLTLTGDDGAEGEVDVPGIERSPFLTQIEAFAGWVLGETTFPFTPQRDLHTMRLLEAAAREGAISLPLPAAHTPSLAT